MFIAQVMNDFTDKGIQINETYIFTQAGRLEPTGDDPSSPLKDTSASLAYTGDLLRYDIPPKNGSSIKLQGKHQATGKAQAGADGEFVSNGENLHFTMNKQQLIPATDIMMLVSGKAGSLPVNFPDFLGEMLIQYFNQHAGQEGYSYVDETVSSDGGIFDVKVPELDQVCDFLNKSGKGFDCKYFADLELVPMEK
jgi:hypothetical protein